jgi:septum site-determining protein MinC
LKEGLEMTLHKTAEAPSIQLKGTNFGIRIVFPREISDDLLLENFEAIPEQTYALPMGTGVVLDFQSRSCSNRLIGHILSRVIWPKGLNVLAWITSDDESAARLTRGGFKTEEPVAEHPEASAGTLILDHSLRSGQHENYPGDVVLVGHLNSGAELFAGGSISILGKLKGLVHAGLRGTEGVYIVAGSFEPQQLRIGGKLYSQIGEDMKWWKKPVIITLEDDGLFFRDWKLEAETADKSNTTDRSTHS